MKHVVLALHGFTGGGASFSALADARPDLEIVAPAIFGHDGERRAATFDDEVSRLCALREALPETAALLGYSLGGRLGLAMLARGARFARAVIIGAGVGLADDAARSARRAEDARFVRVLRERGVEAFASAWEAQPIFATQDDATRRAQRRAHDPEGLARALEVLGLAEMPYLLPALETVTTPIDYVVGERDAKFVETGRMLEARLPGLRLHVVPGVGHDVLLESKESVVALLPKTDERKEEGTSR